MGLHLIIDVVEWVAPVLIPEPWASRAILVTKIIVALAIAFSAVYTLWQSWY